MTAEKPTAADGSADDERNRLVRLLGDRNVASALADSIEASAMEAPNGWGTTVRRDENLVRLNAGPIEVFVVRDDGVTVYVDGTQNLPSLPGIEIGPVGAYESVPCSTRVDVSRDGLGSVWSALKAAHVSLLKQAAATRSGYVWRRSHSPAVLEFLRAELGRRLPDPGYAGPEATLLPATDGTEGGKADSLRERHLECHHPACVATRRLEGVGARLVWGKGRHCEIAVVAATGGDGLPGEDVVQARREYAKHLGVDLRADVRTGDIADSDEPIHIRHALDNYSGARDPTHPINLGGARAAFKDGRFFIDVPPLKGEDWTREECAATVRAYLDLLADDSSGKPINKAAAYRQLVAGPLSVRSAKAVERKFMNVSAVLQELGRPWLTGLVPALNSQALLKDVLKAELARADAVAPSADAEEVAARADALLGAGKIQKPVGSRMPKKKATKASEAPERLPEVAAYVLQEAGGICEACAKPAPFRTKTGRPYLEVHHVRRLADGGSDTVGNAVAVCPACHRRLHLGEDAEAHRLRVYERVRRLLKE